jgi:hypothetical protein
MTIKMPNQKKMYEYETFFHLTAGRDRITKFLKHYEFLKMAKNISGEIVECGVFKGTSFLRLAHIRDILGLKKKLIGFDNFNDNYPNTDISQDKNLRKKWIKNSGGKSISINQLQKVLDQKKIKEYSLIKGDVESTIKNFIKKNPKLKICFLNIDIDFYESTLVCLKYLYPKLSKGGVLVLDNYEFGYGETKAIKNFLSVNKIKKSIFHCLDKKRPVCIIKK